MTVDSWDNADVPVAGRVFAAVRSTLIVIVWTLVLVGPPIAGGVVGWALTSERHGVPFAGLIGEVPVSDLEATVSRQEIEAVGLDPRDLKVIITK